MQQWTRLFILSIGVTTATAVLATLLYAAVYVLLFGEPDWPGLILISVEVLAATSLGSWLAQPAIARRAGLDDEPQV